MSDAAIPHGVLAGSEPVDQGYLRKVREADIIVWLVGEETANDLTVGPGSPRDFADGHRSNVVWLCAAAVEFALERSRESDSMESYFEDLSAA